MRLYSTKESVEAGEVSLLAIVETILAVGLSLWLFDSPKYLIIAVTLAPLVLLRTEESTALGVRMARHPLELFRKYDLWMRKYLVQDYSLIGAILTVPFLLNFLVIIASGFTVRFAATLISTLRRPLGSFSAIPGNLYKSLAVSDVLSLPPLIPGISMANEVGRPKERPITVLFDPAHAIELAFRDHQDPKSKALATYGVICFAVLPTIPYRWSVKATAIAWLPILWVARKAKAIRFQTYLAQVNRSSLGQFVFVFSLLTLTLLAAKLALHNALTDSLAWWQSLDSPFLESLVAPGALPRWQIVSGVNSLAGVFLFFLASHKLIEIETGAEEESMTGWYSFFRSTDVFRTFLSLYTISILIYNVYALSPELDFPPVGNEWFPWPRDFPLRVWEQLSQWITAWFQLACPPSMYRT